jgi:hypothetical protein
MWRSRGCSCPSTGRRWPRNRHVPYFSDEMGAAVGARAAVLVPDRLGEVVLPIGPFAAELGAA